MHATCRGISVIIQRRVGDRWTLHVEVWRVVGQVEEERFVTGFDCVDHELLGGGGPCVRRIQVQRSVRDLVKAVIDEGGLGGRAVSRVVLVSIPVKEVTKETVKSAHQGMRGQTLGPLAGQAHRVLIPG